SSVDGSTWIAVSGATSSSYTLGEGDESRQFRVHATLTDDTGQVVSADSNVSATVVDVAPTLTVSISGSAVEGSTLTATPVQVSDETETVHYQWQSSVDGSTWIAVSGATSSSYTLGEGDENRQFRVHATLTDDTGQVVSADSNVSATVVDVAPTLTVSISGSAVEGSTLTATPVQVSDETETVHYQWQSSVDGSTIG